VFRRPGLEVRHPVLPGTRRRPPVALLARTTVVAGYLVALAVAGRPGWLALGLALALVVVWVVPLRLAAARRRPVARSHGPTTPPQPGPAT
jgi:hypothetical protein